MDITFLYKCRRCGAIERNPRTWIKDGNTVQCTTDLCNAMERAAWNPQRPQAPRSWSLHSCSKHACGVADLIGYEPEDGSESVESNIA